MSRYAIWDKESDVITPSGNVFTAEQWKQKYPIAKIEEVDIVCSGSVINGGIFGVYQEMVERATSEGCDFTGCETKQDFLDAIEAFEDERNSQQGIPDQTRIADALEDLVVLNMPDEEVE